MVANVNFSKTFPAGIPTINDTGDDIQYEFVIEHLGGDDITLLLLYDSILGLNDLDLLQAVADGHLLLSGDDGDGVFESGETWVFTEADGSDLLTYDVTQADFDTNGTFEPDPVVFGDFVGQIDNEARLTTYDVNGEQQSASLETASAPIVLLPGIDIEKATNGEDADDPTGPIISAGDAVTWTYVVTNTGNVALANVVVTDDNGTPGDGSDDFTPTFVGGDTDGDGLLDLNESWSYTANGIAAAGQYGNIADVSGEDPTGEDVTDSDPSHYFGFEEQGPGVRTPGFWQSPFGKQFWDGIVGNEAKAGKECFADGELNPRNGVIAPKDGTILIGDWNLNGIEDGNEDTIEFTIANALNALNNTNKTLTKDAYWQIARDVIASWLNYAAGNPVGDGSEGTPEYYIQEGIDWLNYIDDTGSHPVRSNSTYMKSDINYVADPVNDPTDTFIESGSEIHSALDEYNNFGTIDGVTYAHDCDAEATASTATYNSSTDPLLL